MFRHFVCCGLLIGSGFAFAQERGAQLPSVDVPTKLEPYADLALVQKTASDADQPSAGSDGRQKFAADRR